jgi:conjugal transfer pilus assembly protein TrbC
MMNGGQALKAGASQAIRPNRWGRALTAGVVALVAAGVSLAQSEVRQKSFSFPSDAEIAKQPKPAVPNLDAIDTTPTAPAVDVEALAQRYDQLRNDPASAMNPNGAESAVPAGLFIFVTLSMPVVTLQRLVEQGERTGGVLVLRGLKNRSMRQTVEAAKVVIGDHKVGWVVDPQSFKRYGVQAVPAFVLVAPGAKEVPCSGRECAVKANFSKVSGDVSTAFALDAIERGERGNSQIIAMAKAFRQRLGGRP